MVYLECPYCKETTEHQIIGLNKDKVTTRCTECVIVWEGKIEFWGFLRREIGDKKQ